MNNCRWGKVLIADLTNQKFDEQDVPSDVQEKYIGGKGLASWYLYHLTGEKVDPLGSKTPLIFAAGPLTGTMAPAMRGVAVSASPLTGGFVDSYFGGHFAQEIKYCGYDAIILTGQSESPVCLVLEDNEFKFMPADNYMGLDTFETNHRLKADLGDDTYRVACIGPAGEEEVPFALVSCEYNRHAGRGGIGAVMGSKNLKAVALKGNELLAVENQHLFDQYVNQARQELADSEAVQELTSCGTAATLYFSNESGLLPVYNYQRGTFNPETLAHEAQSQEIWLRDAACHSCPIRCSKVGVIRRGKRRGTVSDIVEYETAALMGTNLGIQDIREVAYLLYKCDALGLDGMSGGSVIGFAMDCFANGILDPADCDGLEVKFGSSQNVPEVLEQIAHRRGYLGELLSKGVAGAAQSLGNEAHEYALHIKGMEIPAFSPRGAPGMALAYLTADRGACHQRAFPIAYEVGGEPFEGEYLERLAIRGKARAVVKDQNYIAATDTLVKCDFGSFGISGDTYRKLYETATGDKLDEERLLRTGERIWNLTRLFNIRQGIISRETERLPRRLYSPLPDGPAAGHSFSREDEEIMLDEYYQVRGWNAEGVPTSEKLSQLEINLERRW